MTQKNLKSTVRKIGTQKRSAVAEVISSLLLVAITVAGAILLSGFLDESFVQGSLAVTSGTETTIKTIKLRGFDTRDGAGLMGYTNLDNLTDQVLCGDGPGCAANPNNSPATGGTEFLVVNIENTGFNPIYLKSVYMENIIYFWDENTSGVNLNAGAATSAGGAYPRSGMYSILSDDISMLNQSIDNQIQSGQTFNLLLKLSPTHPDIELSKPIRVQLNIGANSLSEFLIETGGAQ